MKSRCEFDHAQHAPAEFGANAAAYRDRARAELVSKRAARAPTTAKAQAAGPSRVRTPAQVKKAVPAPVRSFRDLPEVVQEALRDFDIPSYSYEGLERALDTLRWRQEAARLEVAVIRSEIIGHSRTMDAIVEQLELLQAEDDRVANRDVDEEAEE